MRAPGVLWTCWKKRVSSARPTVPSREVLLDEDGLAALESVDAEMAREDREFEDSDGCTLW